MGTVYGPARVCRGCALEIYDIQDHLPAAAKAKFLRWLHKVTGRAMPA